MKEERINKLLEYLRADPEDPFLLYALATEYVTIDLQKAKHYYDTLLLEHEKYIGTYYHAGQLYFQLGDIKKSKEIFEKGMQLAKAQNDMHAFKELQTAYQEMHEDDTDME